MRCDLTTTFQPIAAALPTTIDGAHHIILSAANLPQPADHLATDQLIIKRLKHEYSDCYRADALWFQAHRHTYGYLGLLIFAVLFHAEPIAVHLDLLHPASDIKHLVVSYEYPSDDYPGYHTRPHACCYYPSDPSGYLAQWRPLDAYDLPCFYLTCWQNHPFGEDEWNARDTVRGFGSDQGSARLAELWLNASQPDNSITEYTLESDAGYGGVGHLSAEATFFLPGSLGWMEDEW
jgi:hypothetical protein